MVSSSLSGLLELALELELELALELGKPVLVQPPSVLVQGVRRCELAQYMCLWYAFLF